MAASGGISGSKRCLLLNLLFILWSQFSNWFSGCIIISNAVISLIDSFQGSCTVLDTRMISSNFRKTTDQYSEIAALGTGNATLFKATSVRPIPHGSVRSVTWSPSPLDLLLFAESTNYATVLDCRDFSRQQRLRIKPDYADAAQQSHSVTRNVEISGATWSRNGEHLYVGHEQFITEFRVNTKARRIFPSFQTR